MNDIPVVLPPLIEEVILWLKNNNVPSDGIPFIHYKSMHDHNELSVAVGVLLQSQVMGNAHIVEGIFPAGSYATITYMGDYKNLMEGHIALGSWISKSGLKERQQKTRHNI